jgi:hypothetical protein
VCRRVGVLGFHAGFFAFGSFPFCNITPSVTKLRSAHGCVPQSASSKGAIEERLGLEEATAPVIDPTEASKLLR